MSTRYISFDICKFDSPSRRFTAYGGLNDYTKP
jgi:hypothetical protein